MRILIVEDDRELSQALTQGLRDEGFAVDQAFSGEDGLFEAASGDHDLVILDIMLPGHDGFEILREIRGKGGDVPVVFLTARGELEDRVRGLQLGGDDYLVKPFSFEELLARLYAVLRRRAGAAANALTCGELVLEIDRKRVLWQGQELSTTPREFAILETLLMFRGKVLSRTAIIGHVYDEGYDFDSNLVDVHIGKLRRKLRELSGKPYIETVRGQGFCIPPEAC